MNIRVGTDYSAVVLFLNERFSAIALTWGEVR